MSVLEIVKWKAKPNISDKKMITSVNALVPDLKNSDGFISQVLYKDDSDYWIDIYHWDTAETAHLSNERMADKESLIRLLELIELNTVTIDVLKPLQKSE